MIMTDNGLDLNFEETKRSLGMPVDKHSKYVFNPQKMFADIGKSLREIDYKQYLTRFKWHNLPEGMDSELIERILYFSGSAMFFYIKDLNKFYFLPYGMSGEKTEVGIDFYGRFNRIKPYSFNGSTDGAGEQEGGKRISKADIFLSTQIRDNIKDIPFVKDEAEAKKIFENGAVICWDSSPGLAYYADARNRTCKPYIDYMVEILIQTDSALINASGFNLFASMSESASEIMQMQIDAINEDRRKGKLSAVVSKDLGEITNIQSNNSGAMQDFWNSLQAADNLRLKSLGIQNDGLVQKSQYQNIASQALDINDSLQVYFNAFMERVKFSAIVNSIWGLNIYPEPLLLPKGGETTQEPSEQEDGEQSQAQGGTQDA